MVEVEVWSEDGEVLVSRVVRLVRNSVSTRRNGRYLLPEDDERLLLVPFCSGPLSFSFLTGSVRVSLLGSGS